jgi:hypothetical protein
MRSGRFRDASVAEMTIIMPKSRRTGRSASINPSSINPPGTTEQARPA